jgi:hypothetical protein
MTRRRSPKPEVLAKETEVVKLRRGGLTWDMIAERIGYNSPASAHAAYQRASARIVQDDIEAIRKIETERLDMAQSAIWNKVLQGEIPAVQALIRIQERRAKLLGLDQPFKQQIEVTTYDGNTIDAEVARLVHILDSSPTSALDTPTGSTSTDSTGQ